MEWLYTTWYGILIMCLCGLVVLLFFSALFYKQFFKRFYDIVLSGIALVVLSPLLIILIFVGAIVMNGNPFFTMKEHQRYFPVSKDGKLLPDEKRLVKYGKFLRSTSLDELPELINIFIGDMSIVGPRPLLIEYLPWYNLEEKHRHDVRPGLTGLAQVNGRNNLKWEDRFKIDVEYTKNITLKKDIIILLLTIKKVFSHSDISTDTSKTEGNFAKIREKELEE